MAQYHAAGGGSSAGLGGGDGAAAAAAASPPLYHVAAVDAGLALEPETLSYWGYDDGSGCLLVVKGGLAFAYDVSGGAPPGSPEQLRWTAALPDGPPVVALRLSLDGGLLAVQRSGSGVMLEFIDLASGNVFVQGTDRGRGEILSFFFTELPGSEVVLVTPAGLELLEFEELLASYPKYDLAVRKLTPNRAPQTPPPAAAAATVPAA
ncbi:hypothetical protein GPECTOR_8g18 [Gonium pectorale]|uniref:Regulator of MON1-CCZ1 complex N-terminal domain-containing protein n=1 Tax=Gonium pectorale TaxID=33097 RepID=A0A150GSU6_GONPE|nr:hypothetical protein GPECTOR_8g18 [Gonium pectorale]|eukprot:KXZ52792.1 hypothetical protein GPECTOR_8g18 [Gonium pectorale]